PVITAPASPSNAALVTWTFTSDATAASTTCQLKRGSTLVSAAAPCSGSVSYDLAGQPDGVSTLRGTSTDQAGNSSSATSTYTYRTAPPPAPVITAPPSPTNNANPSWSFTVDPLTTSTCSLTRGGTVVFAAASCTSPVTYALSGKPDGVYTLTVTTT